MYINLLNVVASLECLVSEFYNTRMNINCVKSDTICECGVTDFFNSAADLEIGNALTSVERIVGNLLDSADCYLFYKLCGYRCSYVEICGCVKRIRCYCIKGYVEPVAYTGNAYVLNRFTAVECVRIYSFKIICEINCFKRFTAKECVFTDESYTATD